MPLMSLLGSTGVQLRVAPLDEEATNPRPGRTLACDVPMPICSNWCWAATALGVARFYRPSTAWTQCRIAGAVLGRSDCCGGRIPASCNVFRRLESALKAVGHFVTGLGVADHAIVMEQIDASRPVGAFVAWKGGGGQLLTIVGYDEASNTWSVSDPHFGNGTVSRATFGTAYLGHGGWTRTYLTRS